MAGGQLSAEQGGKGPPNSGWRAPLTIKAGPVREVRSVEGLGLRAHHLIDLEEGTYLTSRSGLAPLTYVAQDRWTERQRDSHQRKAQSCPGPVDRGQLLSQHRGHRPNQVAWREDGAAAAGTLVASRCCVSGELGRTFIEAGPVEEILRRRK